MDCVPFEPGQEKMSTASAVRDKVAFLTGITGQVRVCGCKNFLLRGTEVNNSPLLYVASSLRESVGLLCMLYKPCGSGPRETFIRTCNLRGGTS